MSFIAGTVGYGGGYRETSFTAFRITGWLYQDEETARIAAALRAGRV